MIGRFLIWLFGESGFKYTLTPTKGAIDDDGSYYVLMRVDKGDLRRLQAEILQGRTVKTKLYLSETKEYDDAEPSK